MKYPLKSRVKYKVTSDNIRSFKTKTDDRYVYIFTFPDNSIYIGLTNDLYYRAYKSKSGHFKCNKSAVYNHLIEFKDTYELYVVNSIALKQNDAALLEQNLITYYKEHKKFNLLNRSKGGNLGGKERKWTKDDCIKEASNYKSLVEWRIKSKASYSCAYRHGWFLDCSKHMSHDRKRNGYWTLEKCKEEALIYKNKADWEKNSGSSYGAARKNMWIKMCCEHMENNDRIIRPKEYWTLEKCKEEALKHKTRSNWSTNGGGSYKNACENFWIDDCCKHMLPLISFTFKQCHSDALKFETKSEWCKKAHSTFNYASKKNWVDNCCKHMKFNHKKKFWTFERCLEQAKKYLTTKEWLKESGSSYVIARRNNWLSDCNKHMINLLKPSGYWTLEKCKEEALKYDKRGNWQKNSKSSYSKACKSKWLELCCEHMK